MFVTNYTNFQGYYSAALAGGPIGTIGVTRRFLEAN